MELRPWRIPVSLIEPGPIRTDMWGDVLNEHDRMTKELTNSSRQRISPCRQSETLGRMQKLAADPKKVVKAVDHALASKRPKRRYLLDTVESGAEGRCCNDTHCDQ